MKRTFLALGLALALGASVQAKTPKEVLEPYKAYRTALEAKDAQAALNYAKSAWDAAEEYLGDHKTTGDLAQNYGDIKTGDKASKTQVKAMVRAMELALYYEEGAGLMYLQRGVKLLQQYSVDGQTSKIKKLSKKLVEYSKANGLERSVFYAEILTLQAGGYVSDRDGDRIVEITKDAIDVFDNPDGVYPSAYPIFAHLYQGFGHEYEGDILEAALSYQKVMDFVGKLDYGTHPIVGRALGRWSHMRARLRTADEYDAALEAGLCECWPYDIERNENVEPIERVPPKFSSDALRYGVSGYTIIQFDLDDAGQVINPEIIVSWPPDFYEKSSLKTVTKWKYSARNEDEVDSDRKDLITTIRYEIQDRAGNPVY